MKKISPDFWFNKRVFITGHMGFKGAWLCALLSRLGAQTIGYGKDDRPKLLYRELLFKNHLHIEGDICDLSELSKAMANSKADVLFHLAAQPLVLNSYKDPIQTFETNLMGTVKVLQAARCIKELKCGVIVTTDKVYRNNEWVWGYREHDALGGNDPYSASKAAAEIATHAMTTSFFNASNAPSFVTARAGNVIGGGDWAENRLIPDAAHSLSTGKPLYCRNPRAIRPWQHVLDALAGYMLLAESITYKKNNFTAWNFGPAQEDALTVGDVADIFVKAWGPTASWRPLINNQSARTEAGNLTIDSSRARCELGWESRWSSTDAVIKSANWYRDYCQEFVANDLVNRDITDFLSVSLT